jgi:ferredoxin-NADP reductase
MESASPRSLANALAGLLGLFTAPRSLHSWLRSPGAAGHARILAVKPEGPHTITLTVGPAPFPFVPGQHVDLGVLVDGAFHTRTFSISSAPSPDTRTFDVTIRAAEHGRLTPALVANAEVGTELRVSPPHGDFVLPPGPVLFVTGGSGVTPIMSMLRAARDRGDLKTADIVHLHFERSLERVLFHDELTSLAATHPGYKRTCVLTAEPESARLDARQLAAICPDLEARQALACGPAPLLSAMRAIYTDRSLLDHLQVESFGLVLGQPSAGGASPGNGAAASEGAHKLSFTWSRVRAEGDARTSLLVHAERAGLRPKHGCRRGICHACEAKLDKGVVRDLRTGMTTVGTGACIQLCVNAPVSSVEVVL